MRLCDSYPEEDVSNVLNVVRLKCEQVRYRQADACFRHEIMLFCWETKSLLRPSFRKLQLELKQLSEMCNDNGISG